MPEAFAKDYIQVNERIIAFYAKYPEGSIQSEIIELSPTLVVMRAYAYRTPDDLRPGMGTSSMEIPGRTSFTKGSEIENTETSAWGRAIAALGFEVKRGIASADEIRNKQDDSLGATAPKGDEPAMMRPSGKGPTETFIGILTKAGVIRKGGADGYKLERRETPDGPTFGFRLELSETEESGGHKAIPQVLVPPPVAIPLLASLPNAPDGRNQPEVLEKQTVRVKGHLFQVSQPARTSFYRLVVKEWKDDERSIPPEENLPEPPADLPLPFETPA